MRMFATTPMLRITADPMRITANHCWSTANPLLITLLITANHCESLLITADHCCSLLLTAYHCLSLRITAYHCCSLLLLTANHCCSLLLITANHCSLAAHSTCHHTCAARLCPGCTLVSLISGCYCSALCLHSPGVNKADCSMPQVCWSSLAVLQLSNSPALGPRALEQQGDVSQAAASCMYGEERPRCHAAVSYICTYLGTGPCSV